MKNLEDQKIPATLIHQWTWEHYLPPPVLWLIPILVTIATHLPIFSQEWIPFHDGFYRYQVFYFYYGEFFHTGQIAHWSPYDLYGMPAYYYQWAALNPMAYLVGMVGKWLAIEDTLLLFKCIMLLDTLFFASGVHLLTNSIYRYRLVALVTTLACILTLSWWFQPYFNLYVFYGLPYVLFFLIRFLKTEDGRFFWLAGLMELGTLAGNLPYIGIIHFWSLLLFLLPFIRQRRHLVLAPWRAWPLMVVCLTLLAVYLFFIHGFLTNMDNLSTARDPNSQRTSLEGFLHYGHYFQDAVLSGLLTGNTFWADQDFYPGLMAIFLFLIGLFILKEPMFQGMAAPAIALIWLGMGHFFPVLVFHLPTMDIYRHTAHLFSSAKVWLLLAVGLVLEHLWLRLSGWHKSSTPLYYKAGILVLLLLFIVDCAVTWNMDSYQTPALIDLFFKDQIIFIRILIIAYAVMEFLGAMVFRQAKTIRIAMLLLSLGHLADVSIFQFQAQQKITYVQKEFDSTLFQTTRIPYQSQRTPFDAKQIIIPNDGRSQKALPLVLGIRPFPTYMPIVYPFIHTDPCFPQTRLELIQSPVHKMLELRGGQTKAFSAAKIRAEKNTLHDDAALRKQDTLFYMDRPDGMIRFITLPIPANLADISILVTNIRFSSSHFLPNEDKAFHQALGCGSDKLHLVERPVLARSGEEAEKLFRQIEDPNRQVVVLVPSTIPEQAGATVDQGQIHMKDFSANHLLADVVVPGTQPRWLYYADGWHDGWRAEVNGQPTPLVPANIGFKALLLPAGENKVHLTFSGGWLPALSWTIALAGIMTALLGLLLPIMQLTGFNKKYFLNEMD